MSPVMKKSFDDLDPEEFQMVEGEERRYLDPKCLKVTRPGANPTNGLQACTGCASENGKMI